MYDFCMTSIISSIFIIQIPGAHEFRGALSQSLCVKSLLCISYLWLKEVYFVNLLLALIECTCAVLENVHVRQGHNYTLKKVNSVSC